MKPAGSKRAAWPKLMVFVAIGLSGLDVNGADTSSPSGTNEVDMAYQRLSKIDVFAFGPVGFAGVTSPGELSFRIIAARTNALPLFQRLIKEGNPEAQLYALEGIRRLAPQTAETAAAPLLKANPDVQTMTGCMMRREKADRLVTNILSGLYAPKVLPESRPGSRVQSPRGQSSPQPRANQTR